jgi:small subunit ribosomal protein S17
MKSQAKLRRKRKIRVGTVRSDRMDKTIVVEVERKFRHPLYEKVVRKSAAFKAHDEENKAKIGDVVMIMETRPLSKTKRWRLVEILKSGPESEEKPASSELQ